jgi:hypothetical protein
MNKTLILFMPEKFYPIILVATTGSKVRFKIVYNAAEYAAYRSRFSEPDTSFREVQTLESWYLEKMVSIGGYFK